MGYWRVANGEISIILLQAGNHQIIIKFHNAKKPTSINLIVLHFTEKNNLAEGQMEQDLRKVIGN